LASDVDNPLLGPTGAARVYAPQKGASTADVALLEAALTRWAAAVDPASAQVPGAGAAGGVGYAALTVLAAKRRPGIEVVLDLVGFANHLQGAQLVITGEGSLDTQTLHGKAPAGVAAAARSAAVPVVAVCGQQLLDRDSLAAAGIVGAYALTDIEPDVRRCIAEPGPLLRQLGSAIAADWLPY
jgi:glycerate kinase